MRNSRGILEIVDNVQLSVPGRDRVTGRYRGVAPGLPLVRKFPYRKEILPLGRKKEGNENYKEKRRKFWDE